MPWYPSQSRSSRDSRRSASTRPSVWHVGQSSMVCSSNETCRISFPHTGHCLPSLVVHPVAVPGLRQPAPSGTGGNQPLRGLAELPHGDRLVQALELLGLEDGRVRVGAEPRRLQDLVREARPMPAIARWSRRKAWSRCGCASSAAFRAATSKAGSSGSGPRRASCAAGASGVSNQAPARRLRPVSVIGRARSSSKPTASMDERGVCRCPRSAGPPTSGAASASARTRW